MEDSFRAETPPKRGYTWIIYLLFAAGLIAAVISALVISARRAHKDERQAAVTESPASPTPVAATPYTTTPAPTFVVKTPVALTASPEPEPSEPIITPKPFNKTIILIDGEPKLTLASRQAAESLLSSVTYYFETLDIIPPGAVTELLNEVELVDADPEAATVDYDSAFAYLTGSLTPLQFKSDVMFFQDNVIEHEEVIEYTDALPEGYRLVKEYGMDGLLRIIYSSTYLNGVRRELMEQNRVVVYPAVKGLVLIGTGSFGTGDAPYMSFGEAAPLPEGIVINAPLSGTVIKFFGMYPEGFHHGIDIACASGEQVFASCEGTVVSIMERGAYGLMIEIDHGGGVSTRYSRLGSVCVAVGQEITVGQNIGTVAASYSTPLLHFELRCGSYAYNPLHSIADIEKLDLTYGING